METKEKETELVQLIRQLKDYVILERKDYEKLVQNSSPEKFNESAGVGKFKDSTGKWIDAIIYERDNHVYMREITDFIDKFKKA